MNKKDGRGWGGLPCDKFEGTKRICSQRTLRGFALSVVPLTKKRFMIQGRSQGRIFFGPVKEEITKIGQVFLVWQPLGVSLPLFRLRAPVPELS